MIRHLRNYIIFLLSQLLLIQTTLASGVPTTTSPIFNMTEVADGVFVHQGKHLLPTVNDMDIANVAYIVGSRCVAVVDPGGSLELGQALRAHIASVTPKPVCYLVLTHIHADHVLGAAAFSADKPQVIGHQGLSNALLENIEFFDEHFIPEGKNYNAKQLLMMPDLTLAAGQDMVVDIGDRVLELSAYENAHTSTDVSVFDRNTGTLLLSDLLFMQRIPPLDGTLLGWIKVTETLRGRTADRVVPGHGPVSAEWPAAADDQLEYLYALRDGVRKVLANGGFLEQAVEQVGYQLRDKWQLFDEVHRRNVIRAFTELEWE